MADLSQKALGSSLCAERYSGDGVLSLFVSTNYIRDATRRGARSAERNCAERRVDKLFTEGITRRTMMFAVNDSGLTITSYVKFSFFPIAWLNIAGAYRTVYTER